MNRISRANEEIIFEAERQCRPYRHELELEVNFINDDWMVHCIGSKIKATQDRAAKSQNMFWNFFQGLKTIFS